MNAKRRFELKTAGDYLSKAKEIVDRVLDEEQDALDNMPENLESSPRVEKMEEAVDLLESLAENLEDAVCWVLEVAT